MKSFLDDFGIAEAIGKQGVEVKVAGTDASMASDDMVIGFKHCALTD